METIPRGVTVSQLIINAVPNIQNKRYLELGCHTGATFAAIKAQQKVSVDVKHSPTYKMTTDAYFASLDPSEKFDVVFIDACHEWHHVLRDYNNSVKHLNPNGFIFVHDMIPPDAFHTQQCYCGDTYRLLWWLILMQPISTKWMSLAIDQGGYGLTAFIHPTEVWDPPDVVGTVSYSMFRQALISQKLYTIQEMRQALGVL
jgi:SAM-dependent methyltransferase